MELVSRAQVYVVIPAYNEGTLLSRVVTEVKRAGYAVVVVDDGSGNSTADHAHAAGAYPALLEPAAGPQEYSWLRIAGCLHS